MQNFTYNAFIKSYTKHNTVNPTYRRGQHFINLFIKDSSPSFFQTLWNVEDATAVTMIEEFLLTVQWDLNNLPLLREDLI